jgi:hypothetical protein
VGYLRLSSLGRQKRPACPGQNPTTTLKTEAFTSNTGNLAFFPVVYSILNVRNLGLDGVRFSF